MRIPRSGHLRDRRGWGGKGHGLVEAAAVLEAVVELSEQSIEEVPLGGSVPVSVAVAAPAVVGLGAW